MPPASAEPEAEVASAEAESNPFQAAYPCPRDLNQVYELWFYAVDTGPPSAAPTS